MLFQDTDPIPPVMPVEVKAQAIPCVGGPRHPRKGQGHLFVIRVNLTSYTWGWCTSWLNSSRLHSIAVSVLCMRWRCAVMEPAVISTLYCGHGIRLRSLTGYEYPTPLHFSAMTSYNIPARNVLGWHVIVRDFAKLYAMPYLLKSPTRTFIACCSQSKSRDPTIPLSA